MITNKCKAGQTLHTARYNGRTYTTTMTEWHRILECPMSHIERGMKHHYSMQALIDEEFKAQETRQALFRAFCFMRGINCGVS